MGWGTWKLTVAVFVRDIITEAGFVISLVEITP
jgi:hypothetical protein